MNFRIVLIPLLLVLCVSQAYAQETPDTILINTFTLGEVTIKATEKPVPVETVVSENILERQKQDISQALDLLPGINLSKVGVRNEAQLYLRGYDLRQVPVFIDGMPVYIPYDGYIDLARLQTAGISKISVVKGFSSMLYGANSMGGAINIISRKPSDEFELRGASGLTAGRAGLHGGHTSLNIGSRLNDFYADAGVSFLQNDFHVLSGSFDTLSREADLRRDNSYSRDLQYHARLGYAPVAGHEYVINYSAVRSAKGVPVYLGDNPFNRPRYWRYPQWDKDGFYIHTRSGFSDMLVLQSRWHYDSYDNVLNSYDDASYDSQESPRAFTSTYDDRSMGGALELGITGIPGNQLTLAVHTKYDHHREFNRGETPRSFKDNTMGLSIEDTWKITSRLSMVGGAGYYVRMGLQADDYSAPEDSVFAFPTRNDRSFNYQAGLFYSPVPEQSLYFTLAKKSRFATMKDRYSYRLGASLPNAGLRSEYSLNTEMGFSGRRRSVQWSAALFYHFIDNTIQQVDNVEPGVYQLQNTGRSEFRGMEYSLAWNFLSFLAFGSSYSFIDQKNISHPGIRFTDIPRHKLTGYLKTGSGEKYSVMLDAAWHSERNSTSDGQYKAPSFSVWNLNAGYSPVRRLEFLSFQAGIHNLFDRLYYLVEGYPETGRTFMLTLRYRFSR